MASRWQMMAIIHLRSWLLGYFWSTWQVLKVSVLFILAAIARPTAWASYKQQKFTAHGCADGSLRSGCQCGQVLRKTLFQIVDCQILAVSSRWKVQGASLGMNPIQFWKLGSARSKHWCRFRAHFLVHSWLYSCTLEGLREFCWACFIWAWIPFTRTLLPRPSLLISLPWGTRFQHRYFVGTQTDGAENLQEVIRTLKREKSMWCSPGTI